MPANICILTAPVQAGKTTALMNWAAQKENIGGILAPDAGGLRRLYTLHNRQLADFQLPPAAVAAAPPAEVIAVGKFRFSASAFALARQAIAECLEHPFEWAVIDEVGKLELQGEGLEPAVGQAVAHFKRPGAAGGLLLVVREALLEEVIKHYGLEECRVIRLGEALPE